MAKKFTKSWVRYLLSGVLGYLSIRRGHILGLSKEIIELCKEMQGKLFMEWYLLKTFIVVSFPIAGHKT